MKNIIIDGIEYTPVITENKNAKITISFNFEVYYKDLGKMNWNEAKKACESLGEGWRLPTREELNIMYQNKEVVGGFANFYYWSSTENDNNNAGTQNFTNGYQTNTNKYNTLYVRAIRNL